MYNAPVVPAHLLVYYHASLLLLFNAPSNGWSQVQPTLQDVELQSKLEGLETSKTLTCVRALFPIYIKWQNERSEEVQDNSQSKQLPKVGRS